MKNSKLCLLASTAILTNLTIAHGSDDGSNIGHLSERSGASTPVTSVAEKIKFHYKAQLSISETQTLKNEQALQRIESLKAETHSRFINEETDLSKALEELRSTHHEVMGALEQNTKDVKHEQECTLDISAYSQYIITVLLGIEAFTHNPEADIDAITLFVAMRQLSESNYETIRHMQRVCDGMDNLVRDAKQTFDNAKSCGLYAHVNEEVAKTNVMALVNEILKTRSLLDTFNADIQKQILSTDEMKNMQATIWQQANPNKPAQELLTDVMNILNGNFIPFANYPDLPPELSAPAIGELVAHHPKAKGITIQIAHVVASLKEPSLTSEAAIHLANLQKTIAQGISDLDSIRPETKLYKLMKKLEVIVGEAATQQGDEFVATKAIISTLLNSIESCEEFQVLGMFVQDVDSSRTLIDEAKALIV